jgi:hypothetical protein
MATYLVSAVGWRLTFPPVSRPVFHGDFDLPRFFKRRFWNPPAVSEEEHMLDRYPVEVRRQAIEFARESASRSAHRDVQDERGELRLSPLASIGCFSADLKGRPASSKRLRPTPNDCLATQTRRPTRQVGEPQRATAILSRL